MAGILANENLRTQASEYSKTNGLPETINGLLVLANLHESAEAVRELQTLFTEQPKAKKEKALTPEALREQITTLQAKVRDARSRGAFSESIGYTNKITALRNTLAATEG